MTDRRKIAATGQRYQRTKELCWSIDQL